MSRKCAIAIKFHRGVECSLPAHRGQKGIRLFTLDDRLDHFGGNRLDISAIGEFRIGHDGRRVRIDEHDLITFFAQSLARLHAGIIKFAALPDHDWTGTDKQDFF